MDTSRPERDVSDAFLRQGAEWLAESGELLVVLRYLRAAGAKDFALCRSVDEFQGLVELAPPGTDIILCRGRHLPLRGVVTEPFVAEVLEAIPDGTEYLLLTADRRSESAVSLGTSWSNSRADLQEVLADSAGREVAVGECPHFMGPDNESITSASKGGIDGPR